MTRSSEKLAGNWEARIAAAAPPIDWARIARRATMLSILLLITRTALFGFS